MKKSFFIHLLLATTAATLASCGGSGGQPVTKASAGFVMTQLSSALSKLPTSNTTPTLPMSGVSVFSNTRSAPVTCETVTPATVTDADGDGIALTKTGTFDCADYVSGATQYNRKGSYTITDKNDSVAGLLGGIRIDFNLTDFSYTDTTQGMTFTESYVGRWDYTATAGGGLVSDSDFTGHFKFTSDSPYMTGIKVDYNYNYTWNWSVTPTSASSTWTAGTSDFTGTYSLNGFFDHEDNAGVHTQGTGDFKVKYYSQNIKYDSTCAKWYKTGSIFVEDGSNTMEIRYACSSAKFYVNGALSDWWTP